MASQQDRKGQPAGLSRRDFCRLGGAAALGAAAGGCAGRPAVESDPARAEAAATQAIESAADPAPGRIASYRRLGRTEFMVSDLSMGCGSIAESNVVRYAYDHGINLFDTAEGYGSGDSETKIGQAMQHMDRSKIFIVTKLGIGDRPDETAIRDRFLQCLERLQTDYVDALYMHGVADVSLLGHEPFHRVVASMKAEGKLRHAGVSSHGPRAEDPSSMEEVLLAAAEDGRFDVFLLSYSFTNKDEGEAVLAACRKHDIGTTIMKAATGLVALPVLDPDNPSEQVQAWLDSLMARGQTRDEALERIASFLERQRPQHEESLAKTKPFLEKYGINSQDELDRKSYQWVLRNPDAHTICISMRNFDGIDRWLPISGTQLTAAGSAMLEHYAAAYGAQQCRIGCTDCSRICPEHLSASTILRYAYYYRKQGRQKEAMRLYARLGGRNASACLSCQAPCQAACPHGVAVQARLCETHGLLSMA